MIYKYYITYFCFSTGIIIFPQWEKHYICDFVTHRFIMAARIDLPATATELTALNDADSNKLIEEIKTNRAILDSYATNQKTPYLPHFSGEAKGVDFKLWKSTVSNIRTTHQSDSVVQAIRKSLQGNASKVLSNLPFDASIDDIVTALTTVYGEVKDASSSWQLFYATLQGNKEDLCTWHTRLSSILFEIPNLTAGTAQCHLKTRLFHGLHNSSLKESVRHKFDDPDVTASDLLHYLRKIDGERKVTVKSVNLITGTDQVANLELKVASLTAKLEALQKKDDSCKPVPTSKKKKGTPEPCCSTDTQSKPHNNRGGPSNNGYRNNSHNNNNGYRNNSHNNNGYRNNGNNNNGYRNNGYNNNGHNNDYYNSNGQRTGYNNFRPRQFARNPENFRPRYNNRHQFQQEFHSQPQYHDYYRQPNAFEQPDHYYQDNQQPRSDRKQAPPQQSLNQQGH